MNRRILPEKSVRQEKHVEVRAAEWRVKKQRVAGQQPFSFMIRERTASMPFPVISWTRLAGIMPGILSSFLQGKAIFCRFQ
jgi:hypothetical protein